MLPTNADLDPHSEEDREPIAEPDPVDMLREKRVVFLGKLGSMTRRDVRAFVRQRGGQVVRADDPDIDMVVIGAEELPVDYRELFSPALRSAAAAGRLEVLTETEWWQRLGVMEAELHVRQLYTPAMLADLVGVSVSVIRRWHRRGLIVPVREVHRLPYFDFREVLTARQLAGLLAAGVSPKSLERELEQLARFVPNVDRPLAQLAIIAEGTQLLLRQGEGLIDADGQRRFDFASIDARGTDGESVADDQGECMVGDIVAAAEECLARLAPGYEPAELHDGATDAAFLEPASDDVSVWLDRAMAYEDCGQLEAAVEHYRMVQVLTGPNAEWCFRLAELLYRLGDVTAARERYYMAIELDEDFVEARANLGCVLAELGQVELAVAAFQGALARHQDYPDVQYHLARLLDDLDRCAEAETHWRSFLELAPASPWADDARERLGVVN